MGLLSRLTGSSDITPARAAADAEAGIRLLVDVREPSEWTAGHSPHAKHIPLGQLQAKLGELSAAGKPLAFVCRSGGRSAQATAIARRAGLDASNVGGGMIAWQRAGLATRSGRR